MWHGAAWRKWRHQRHGDGGGGSGEVRMGTRAVEQGWRWWFSDIGISKYIDVKQRASGIAGTCKCSLRHRVVCVDFCVCHGLLF